MSALGTALCYLILHMRVLGTALCCAHGFSRVVFVHVQAVPMASAFSLDALVPTDHCCWNGQHCCTYGMLWCWLVSKACCFCRCAWLGDRGNSIMLLCVLLSVSVAFHASVLLLSLFFSQTTPPPHQQKVFSCLHRPPAIMVELVCTSVTP